MTVQRHPRTLQLDERGALNFPVPRSGAAASAGTWSVAGNSTSRRTAIDLITGPLAPYRDSLTLIGGQAVMLRTIDRFDLATDTDDADFAITPQLVTDDPKIEDELRKAGFEPRSTSRPGLWGRQSYTNPVTGQKAWAEMLDLDCPLAFSGATSPKRRSVPALSSHGRQATGAAVGLELAVIDRELLTVTDLMDTSRASEMWVAGQAGLLCAKSYKIGERLYETGGKRFSRPKDYLDFFLLLDSSDPGTVATVFNKQKDDPVIGNSVRQGATFIRRLLSDPAVKSDLQDALGRRVPSNVLNDLYEAWRRIFPDVE